MMDELELLNELPEDGTPVLLTVQRCPRCNPETSVYCDMCNASGRIRKYVRIDNWIPQQSPIPTDLRGNTSAYALDASKEWKP